MKKAEKIIETAVVTYEEKALSSYEITPAEVALKAKEYMALKVLPEDPKTYQVARAALTMCVTTRTSVDKRRKELGEDSRKWVAAVNQAAKDLLAPLAPAEDHLRGELDLEDGRRAEVKAEKARIEKARVDGIRAKIESIRSNALRTLGKTAEELTVMLDNVSTIQIDEFYQEFREEARKVLDEVKEMLNKAITARMSFEIEEAVQKEEAARLAKQKAEQEAIEKAQAEERMKLKEAQDKLEAEKKAELDRVARAQFEENARIQAEADARAKVEREEKERREYEDRLEAKRKAQAEKEAAEKVRQEALRPDKEKLIAYGEALLAVVEPELTDKRAKAILADVNDGLDHILTLIKTEVKTL